MGFTNHPSGAKAAAEMTDLELESRLVSAGMSKTTAYSAVDIFRLVCEAVETGEVTPRSGWLR